MKINLCILLSMLTLNAYAGQDRGGGDLCENQIKVIREDLASWIQKGGPRGLKLPSGVSVDRYSEGMLSQISKARVRCVGPGDKGFPVEVYGTPKVCKFETGVFRGATITCERPAFSALSESDQYVLVHHEYAGLAGIEQPTKDDSVYNVSNQISAFLVDYVVKRLAVKAPVAGDTQSSWQKLNGREAVELARSLQDAVAATKFTDCDVTLESNQPADPITCEGATYYYNRFHFVPKDKSVKPFMSIPVGNFFCDDVKSDHERSLMVANNGKTILNVLDKNVYHDKGEEDLHLRLETVFELDRTATKIAKVTITKSKVTQVNKGTVGNPRWGAAYTPIRSVVCHGNGL